MKVAAWQAPLAVRDPEHVVARLRAQVERCEAAGVEVLCCPETVIGGLADGVPDPGRFAFGPGDSDLLDILAPVLSTTVILIVGFTERDAEGRLFNTAAIVNGGEVVGRYRKVCPATGASAPPGPSCRRSCSAQEGAPCGIAICNDVSTSSPRVSSQNAAPPSCSSRPTARTSRRSTRPCAPAGTTSSSRERSRTA